jgi:cell division protein FtsL
VSDERDEFEADYEFQDEYEESDEAAGEFTGYGRYNFANQEFEPTPFEHDLDEFEHRHGDDEEDDDATDSAAGNALDADADADADGAAAKDHPSGIRRASWERPTRIAVGTLAVIAIMFLFVFPTRSYLAQQRQVGNARHAVQVLAAQNEQLIRQKEQLQTPAEIERLAREQFNMVLPGEQAYNVLSTARSATTTTTTP